MLLKGKQAASFAKRPDPAIWAVVAFGEDEGLANDAARMLLDAWKPKTAELEVITLDEDEVRKDATLLFDALEAVSLLGDERVIRVRTKGDKIAGLLVDAIESGDENNHRFAARLIVETGSLKAKSKLRKAAESAKHTACLQLFADEAGDITSRVEAALLSEGATISPDALALFVGDLPGHRRLANSEIEKLCLYTRGLGRPVEPSDIRALCATDIDHNMATAIKATLRGDPKQAHAALDKLDQASTSAISILRSLQMEVNRMLDAQIKIAGGNPNAGMSLRPPVWKNEWAAYRTLLDKWPAVRLRRVLERIYDAELQAKSASSSASATVRILMNDLARAAEKAS